MWFKDRRSKFRETAAATADDHSPQHVLWEEEGKLLKTSNSKHWNFKRRTSKNAQTKPAQTLKRTKKKLKQARNPSNTERQTKNPPCRKKISVVSAPLYRLFILRMALLLARRHKVDALQGLTLRDDSCNIFADPALRVCCCPTLNVQILCSELCWDMCTDELLLSGPTFPFPEFISGPFQYLLFVQGEWVCLFQERNLANMMLRVFSFVY